MTDDKYQMLIDDFWAINDILEITEREIELFQIVQDAISALDNYIENMPEVKSLDDEAKIHLAYQYYRLREKYFKPNSFDLR